MPQFITNSDKSYNPTRCDVSLLYIYICIYYFINFFHIVNNI